VLIIPSSWGSRLGGHLHAIKGQGAPPPHYIKGPQGWELNHNFPQRKSHESSSTSLVRRPPPRLLPSSLSLPSAWPPEGLRRLETSSPLHAIMLRSFRIPSNIVYFRNFGWIRDSRGHRDCRTCASMRRCRSCGAEVIAPRSPTTLRSATSFHCQRLCGSVIPAFSLQGYITELLFTVAALLIDRSMGNSGLHRNTFLLFVSNPKNKVTKRQFHALATKRLFIYFILCCE
jgi:hypothetical protein